MSLASGLPRVQLPLEIHCMILDFTAHDKASLAACALVCKTWHPLARAHHFKSFTLTSQTNVSASPLLCDSASSVLPFIRDLSIQEGHKRDRTLWVAKLLPRMRLNELANLESLTLDRFYWADYRPHARAAVLSALSNVKELRLPSLYTTTVLQMLELLAAAPLLRSLVYNERNDSIWRSEAPEDVIVAHSPPACIPPGLTHLQTNHRDLLRAIRCTTPHPPLTTLVVHELCTATAVELLLLLRASGSTLEHLTLRFIPFADAQPEDTFLALGGLTHSRGLRALTLSATCAAYLPILEQLTSPHIRAVSIALTPYAVVFGQGSFDLRKLAALFSRPLLARARLRLVVNEIDLDVLLGLRRTARERLALLWEEGRLDFWSRAVGAGTDALLDAHEASAGERDAAYAFRWPPVNIFESEQ